MPGTLYVLLQRVIRLGIMQSKHVVASFSNLTSVLSDILCMSEMTMSSNAAMSELYFGLSPIGFRQTCFAFQRCAWLDVARTVLELDCSPLRIY